MPVSAAIPEHSALEIVFKSRLIVGVIDEIDRGVFAFTGLSLAKFESGVPGRLLCREEPLRLFVSESGTGAPRTIRQALVA
jgi:hypothetical protein